jgi:hypothetical protein
MKCIIQVDESGNPIEHPIVLDNFVEAFPNLDISNDTPPQGYAWFIRKNIQDINLSIHAPKNHKIACRYTRVSSTTIEDEFYYAPLTQEEITNLDEDFRASSPPFASWTADYDNRIWVPPTPMPTDGNYYWNEKQLSWIKIEVSAP